MVSIITVVSARKATGLQNLGLLKYASRFRTTDRQNYTKELGREPIIRKRGGVQKSMGHKVPWKIGMLICHPVTSRPLIFPQKEAVLSACNFATTHLIACMLNFYLP